MTIDPRNLVTLLVNGQEFGGWTSVSISAGLDRMARDFSLGVTRAWPDSSGAAIARRVTFGDSCEVYIGDTKVLTGYVDGTPIRYDGRTVDVQVVGRSKTADLVDCAADVPTGQIRGKTALGIASALAAPYGVAVRSDVEPGEPIAEHQVEQGETVAESIQRVIDLRQMLATDDADGALVLTRAGSGRASTALVLGENVLSGEANLDGRDRFSEYRVKGQRSGTDDDFGEAVAGQMGVAHDKGVPRRRVKIETAKGQATIASCRDQARWHAAYRMGKSFMTTYTVQGWRQADGRLWVPNELVPITDPIIGWALAMLIGEVKYSLDTGGTVCELTVAPKVAWEKLPEIPKVKGKQSAFTGEYGVPYEVKLPS